MSEPELLAADMRSRAGHYEVLGETYAKFEFFEKGWNPYSRFLDRQSGPHSTETERNRAANLSGSPSQVWEAVSGRSRVGTRAFRLHFMAILQRAGICRAPRSEGFLHRIRPL